LGGVEKVTEGNSALESISDETVRSPKSKAKTAASKTSNAEPRRFVHEFKDDFSLVEVELS
jgi:hypothetical protein